jgi:hypothetical protein
MTPEERTDRLWHAACDALDALACGKCGPHTERAIEALREVLAAERELRTPQPVRGHMHECPLCGSRWAHDIDDGANDCTAVYLARCRQTGWCDRRRLKSGAPASASSTSSDPDPVRGA